MKCLKMFIGFMYMISLSYNIGWIVNLAQKFDCCLSIHCEKYSKNFL